ncbi:hypothetical protein [Escherichia coli]|uniref:hypothetical protein n=1 Tax=Escherichia coli TaxID=562 RepID=UPI003B9C5AD0
MPVDGVVIKVNEARDKKTLGETAYFPKWAIAFKSNKPGVETTIKNIVFQIGRTGTITPVAEISQIDGTTGFGFGFGFPQ